MSEERRAVCVELAEIESMIKDLDQRLDPYRKNTEPQWGHVQFLRSIKRQIREMLKWT